MLHQKSAYCSTKLHVYGGVHVCVHVVGGVGVEGGVFAQLP